MNATTIQNVVTYNTMVAFDNLDLRLFPGMTAYVSIPVAEAKNVVKIPNGALRYKPDLADSQISALYAKYGIKDNARATPAARIGHGDGWIVRRRCRAVPQRPRRQAPQRRPAADREPRVERVAAAAAVRGRPGRRWRKRRAGRRTRRRRSGGRRRQDSAVVWKLLPDKITPAGAGELWV